MKQFTAIRFALLTVFAGLFLTVAAQAATLTVTKTADTNDTVCDADCSLREAFDVADGNGQADTINFNIPTTDAGCGGTASCTITLTSAIEPAADGGNLTTVTGTGVNNITLSGGNATRLFNILSNVKVSMNFLTISGGNGVSATNSGIGGAILISGAGSELTLDNVILQNNSTSNNNPGGAIDVFTSGSLIITNSIVRNNTATNSGGGIIVVGTAQITNVTFSGNTSTGNGGGLRVTATGQATVTNSTFSGNNANNGGGISNSGSTTVTNSNINGNSTVNGNPATNSGGGLHNLGGTLTVNSSTINGNSTTNTGAGIFISGGTLTLNNSTVSGNTGANYGGGGIRVENGSNATLNNSTISGNTAGNVDSRSGGGGISVVDAGSSATINSTTFSNNSATNAGGGVRVAANATITLNNTIIANSTSGGECVRDAGTINATYSLIEDNLTCVNGTNSNNLTGDPNLGALGNNGGPTQTHALLPGSIAIDKGNSTLTTDQRGSFRPVNDPNSPNGTGNLADIGSFEVQTTTAASVSIGGRVLVSGGRGLANALVYLTDQSGNTRVARSSAFGYYRFETVAAGQTVIVTVVSKRYQFTPQVINITEDLSELNFVSEEANRTTLKQQRQSE